MTKKYLINMNARLYDPAVGRFLSPDPYVLAPTSTQNFNRYSYAMNNPMKYTDPSGEWWWLTFGLGNTIAHAFRGDINSFGDVLKYFSQGAVTGLAYDCSGLFEPVLVTNVGMGVVGTLTGGFDDGWKGVGDGAKAFLGNFYLDENSWMGGVVQGFLRHTWEMPQTLIGHLVTQIVNTSGEADRVDYLGGATYATQEERSGQVGGISLGNFINIRTSEKIEGDFDDFVISCNDQTFMHEYGHTKDSRAFGLSYLFVIGIPSSFESKFGENPRHSWTEIRANKRAYRYFKKHYNISRWNERENPLKK